MQYNMLSAIASRSGELQGLLRQMPLRIVVCILLIAAPLSLGGCADTAPSERGFKPFASLMRSDDQTLTKAEQAAAISELRNEKSKQAQQAGQEVAVPPTKVVPAKTTSATPTSATPANAAE